MNGASSSSQSQDLSSHLECFQCSEMMRGTRSIGNSDMRRCLKIPVRSCGRMMHTGMTKESSHTVVSSLHHLYICSHILVVGTTTAATTLVENRLKSERNASSVSGLSARHSKSDAGSEVASTPILIKEECLPVEPLGGDTGMSAEPRSQLPARSANPQPIPLGRTRLFDDGQSFVIACAANDVISVEGIQFGNAQRPKKAKPNATSQFKGVTK